MLQDDVHSEEMKCGNQLEQSDNEDADDSINSEAIKDEVESEEHPANMVQQLQEQNNTLRNELNQYVQLMEAQVIRIQDKRRANKAEEARKKSLLESRNSVLR